MKREKLMKKTVYLEIVYLGLTFPFLLSSLAFAEGKGKIAIASNGHTPARRFGFRQAAAHSSFSLTVKENLRALLIILTRAKVGQEEQSLIFSPAWG
jgi:hypothetical protein